MRKIILVIIIFIGLFGLTKQVSALTFIDPVLHTFTQSDAWFDEDLSADIPSGATGVVLHIYNKDGTAEETLGFRKNGSTDNRTNEMEANDNHFWVAIGVDANRIVELYFGIAGDFDVYVVGYFTDDASFFTNAVDKSLGGTASWTDIDISSDTGGDTAIGAAFELIVVTDASYKYGLRKNGSTDDKYQDTSWHSAAIIGVDGSEICEGEIENTAVDFFLVGYITKDSIFNTNATDLSLGSTGSWIDLSALPSGATGGFIEVVSTDDAYEYGLRKNGSAESIVGDAGQAAYGATGHIYGIVEADASQLIEGQISNTGVDFFLVGYSEAAAAAEAVEPAAIIIFD